MGSLADHKWQRLVIDLQFFVDWVDRHIPHPEDACLEVLRNDWSSQSECSVDGLRYHHSLPLVLNLPAALPFLP